MIRYEKIKWKNFLSTGNDFIEIDLSKNGSTLICGENGSGKSTLLDAITYSLFGKPFRNINKPQLVNTTNEKDCLVEIEFSTNNRDYLVRRGIKPNIFDIEVNGQLLHKEADDRANQRILEENILKVVYGILGNDFKIGALDMREPIKGTGLQDLHIDWLPKNNENEPTQNIVAFIFLDDANVSNGSMRIVPKTHKKIGWIDDYQKDKSSHPDEIYLDAKESDIALMDANLWHSGTTNHTGNRRRVLYLDIRRREIPQLLNQRIYLDEITQSKLDDVEKYLLGLRETDSIFEDRVYTVGNVYRKQFNTDVVVKEQ